MLDCCWCTKLELPEEWTHEKARGLRHCMTNENAAMDYDKGSVVLCGLTIKYRMGSLAWMQVCGVLPDFAELYCKRCWEKARALLKDPPKDVQLRVW